MNRDDFIALLSRLASDGEISEADAMDLLLQFDAGTLPDDWELPLPVAEGIRQGHDDKTTEAALMALLLLLTDHGLEMRVRPLSQLVAVDLADAVQGAFEQRVAALAAQLANGSMHLFMWQEQMIAEIEQHITQHMMLGGGSQTLTRVQLQRLDEAIRTQSAFLQRFADQVALHAGRGEPFSAEYFANRSQLYGGVGRGEFFRSNEEGLARRGDARPGIVIDYESRDDNRTCFNCLDAELRGPYLPGEGVWPGEICLGRGYCRCRRVPRYNPAAYARLTGQN